MTERLNWTENFIPKRVSDGVYGHLKKNRHVDFTDC